MRIVAKCIKTRLFDSKASALSFSKSKFSMVSGALLGILSKCYKIKYFWVGMADKLTKYLTNHQLLITFKTTCNRLNLASRILPKLACELINY